MLLGDTSYDPGTVVDVDEGRAVDLLAEGHAEFVERPSPGLEARVAARKAELVIRDGTPPRPAGAVAALRAAFGRLPG
jgi:hypothetical protein